MKFSKSEWCPRQDLKLFVPKRQKRANHADISDSIGCILILGKCPKMPNRTLKSGKVVLYSTVKKQALTTGTRPVFRTIIDWRPCAERTRAGGQNSIGKAAAKKSRLPARHFRLCCRCELADRSFLGNRDAGRGGFVVGLAAAPQVQLRARHALRLFRRSTFAQHQFHHFPRAQGRASADHRKKQMRALAGLVQLR